MKFPRLLLFFLSILIGIAGGLYFGWKVQPVEYANTPLSSLRADYRADTVLMIAEIYRADGDLRQAANRLARLGPQHPSRLVAEAILNANEAGFATSDLETLAKMAQAFQNWTPADPYEAKIP